MGRAAQSGPARQPFADATVADVLAEIKSVALYLAAVRQFNWPESALTPYSAGWIKENGMFIRDIKYQLVFDKFNRTVWNWIYGNVTAAASSNIPPVRETLYEDVKLPTPKRPSLYQSLIKTSSIDLSHDPSSPWRGMVLRLTLLDNVSGLRWKHSNDAELQILNVEPFMILDNMQVVLPPAPAELFVFIIRKSRPTRF